MMTVLGNERGKQDAGLMLLAGMVGGPKPGDSQGKSVGLTSEASGLGAQQTAKYRSINDITFFNENIQVIFLETLENTDAALQKTGSKYLSNLHHTCAQQPTSAMLCIG